MSDLTTYAETLLLNWLFNQGAPTRPSAYYLGIHNGDPGETGADNEQNDTDDIDYVRPALTFGDAAEDGIILTTASVSYTPDETADPFTVSHVSIWDADAEGNCLFKGELVIPRTIINAKPLSLAAGDLACALD